MAKILEAKNLSVTQKPSFFAKKRLMLDDVSFSIGKGEIVAFVGERTEDLEFLKRFICLDIKGNFNIESGSLIIRERPSEEQEERIVFNYMGHKSHQISKSLVNYADTKAITDVFPKHKFVGQQLVKIYCKFNKDKTEIDGKKEVIDLLEILRVENPFYTYNMRVEDLSPINKSKILIAKVIVTNPKIVLVEKPLFNLIFMDRVDRSLAWRKLVEKYGFALIVFTSDLIEAVELASHVNIFYSGRILETGQKEEIIDFPQHPFTWGLVSSYLLSETDDELTFRNFKLNENNIGFKGDYFLVNRFPAYVQDLDKIRKAPLFEVSPTHFASTWLLGADSFYYEPPQGIVPRWKKFISEHNIEYIPGTPAWKRKIKCSEAEINATKKREHHQKEIHDPAKNFHKLSLKEVIFSEELINFDSVARISKKRNLDDLIVFQVKDVEYVEQPKNEKNVSTAELELPSKLGDAPETVPPTHSDANLLIPHAPSTSNRIDLLSTEATSILDSNDDVHQMTEKFQQNLQEDDANVAAEEIARVTETIAPPTIDPTLTEQKSLAMLTSTTVPPQLEIPDFVVPQGEKIVAIEAHHTKETPLLETDDAPVEDEEFSPGIFTSDQEFEIDKTIGNQEEKPSVAPSTTIDDINKNQENIFVTELELQTEAIKAPPLETINESLEPSTSNPPIASPTTPDVELILEDMRANLTDASLMTSPQSEPVVATPEAMEPPSLPEVVANVVANESTVVHAEYEHEKTIEIPLQTTEAPSFPASAPSAKLEAIFEPSSPTELSVEKEPVALEREPMVETSKKWESSQIGSPFRRLRGRPRKVYTTKELEALVNTPKRPRGRPRKVYTTIEMEALVNTPKRPRGRPRKVYTTIEMEVLVSTPKRPRGRPRKERTLTEMIKLNQPKRPRGRPKKVETIERERQLSDFVPRKTYAPKVVVVTHKKGIKYGRK